MVDLFQFYSIYSNGDITEILLLVYNLTLNSNHLSHKATTIFLSGDWRWGWAGIFIVLIHFFSEPSSVKIFFFSWEGKQKLFFLSCGTEIHFSINIFSSRWQHNFFFSYNAKLILFRSARALNFFFSKKIPGPPPPDKKMVVA